MPKPFPVSWKKFPTMEHHINLSPVSNPFFNIIYFRDMSHLIESINNLLRPTTSFNFYKREGGNNKIASQLVFQTVSYQPSLVKTHCLTNEFY